MALHPSDLWNWRGRTGRLAYFQWGIALMALKYNLDRLLAWQMEGTPWPWQGYWKPFQGPLDELAPDERRLAFALLVLALPFIAAGIVLTVRRLRDAGWPLWLSALFFVPALNLLFFLLLCFTPSRETGAAPPPIESQLARFGRRFLGLGNPVASAVFAIALTGLLTAALTALAGPVFQHYGWGVFVALPFCLGMFAALFHSALEPRTWGACASVASLSLLFTGVALLAMAVEGVVCLFMALPIAAPIALLGATAGYHLQISRWARAIETGRLYAVAWLALPLALAVEAFQAGAPPLVAVTTRVEIAAPADRVWRHVVTFAELPPPRELIFRSGIAYPVRATIRGTGVGAIRYCEFSTGAFIEPITAWDEGRRLAFDVASQPHPMRELSPYRKLQTQHLEGFFESRRGQFLLTALPDGRTLLEGTTWYAQRFWPGPYWRLWSDYLVHRIHERVLEHIKAEAERAPF